MKRSIAPDVASANLIQRAGAFLAGVYTLGRGLLLVLLLHAMLAGRGSLVHFAAHLTSPAQVTEFKSAPQSQPRPQSGPCRYFSERPPSNASPAECSQCMRTEVHRMPAWIHGG